MAMSYIQFIVAAYIYWEPSGAPLLLHFASKSKPVSENRNNKFREALTPTQPLEQKLCRNSVTTHIHNICTPSTIYSHE